MTCGQSNQSGCSFPQHLVNQGPNYEKRITKEKRLHRSKGGIQSLIVRKKKVKWI